MEYNALLLQWCQLWKDVIITLRFKAKVVLSAFKGDKTIIELSRQFEVHPNQTTSWKKQLLENVEQVFGSTAKLCDETHVKELHAKIGQSTL